MRVGISMPHIELCIENVMTSRRCSIRRVGRKRSSAAEPYHYRTFEMGGIAGAYAGGVWWVLRMGVGKVEESLVWAWAHGVEG